MLAVELAKTSHYVCMTAQLYTRTLIMRTNIEIDDELLTAVMQATKQTTKKATVEMALRQVLDAHSRALALAESAGMGWEGDLEAMRTGRA